MFRRMAAESLEDGYSRGMLKAWCNRIQRLMTTQQRTTLVSELLKMYNGCTEGYVSWFINLVAAQSSRVRRPLRNLPA